jgi:hypothetical protein
MSINQIIITKASGEKVVFSEEHLKVSLMHSGANDDEIAEITEKIKAKLYDGMATKAIYKLAAKLLKKSRTGSAAKYKLKQSLMELGPSGYPFEKFVGELLKKLDYKTSVQLILEGVCISHEVDVLAEKANEVNIIECKFRNRAGYKIDVKSPLYVQSRFKDIEAKFLETEGPSNKKVYKGWLITNTRFSLDALKYGQCVGLNLMSWDQPKNHGLKELIDQAGLHPITSLTSLSKKEKQVLLNKNIVLCREILASEDSLNSLGMSSRKRKKILEECRMVCDKL